MMKNLRVLLVLLAALAAVPASSVNLPLRIPFQGKLVDPVTNQPKNGSFGMTFRLYRNPADAVGSAVYTETQTAVPVVNGTFAVQIGTVTLLGPDLFADATAYLGVQVTGDASEMSPRHPLSMSPYAYTAMQLVSHQDIRVNAGVAYATFTSAGNLLVPGTVQASSAVFIGSGTFMATGASQYSLQTSSGLLVNGGTLRAAGSGGVDVLYGVKAATFTGNGADLVGTAPQVSNSSNSAGGTFVAGTETVIVSTSIVLHRANNQVLIMGLNTVVRAVNTATTCTLRVRVNTAGACGTASTLVYAHNVLFPTTTGNSMPVPTFAVHAPGTTATAEYCLTNLCTIAQQWTTGSLTLLEVSP